MVVVVQFLSLESLSWPTTNIEYGQLLPTQIIFGFDFICRNSEVRFTYRQSFIHDWCTLFLLLKCLMWHAVAITGVCRAVCSIGSV
jgi:hypothetical protein